MLSLLLTTALPLPLQQDCNFATPAPAPIFYPSSELVIENPIYAENPTDPDIAKHCFFGASADIAIFEMDTTPGKVVDFDRNEMATGQRLRSVATYRAGRKLVPPVDEMETLDVLNRSNPWTNY